MTNGKGSHLRSPKDAIKVQTTKNQDKKGKHEWDLGVSGGMKVGKRRFHWSLSVN